MGSADIFASENTFGVVATLVGRITAAPRILKVRPNMKKNRSLGKLTDPAKPIQGITLSDEKENQLRVESNLSPERIMEGAFTATALLNQILAQGEQLHQVRDWGMNE